MTALQTEMYTRAMRALDFIGQGVTPTKACDQAGIGIQTVRKYINNDPVLQEFAEEATQRGYDTMADALLHINDAHSLYGTTDPKEQKIISDNIKWYLARKHPTVYGDKVVIENNYTVDKVIVEALARGRERALLGQAVVEEALYTIVEDEVDISEFL